MQSVFSARDDPGVLPESDLATDSEQITWSRAKDDNSPVTARRVSPATAATVDAWVAEVSLVSSSEDDDEERTEVASSESEDVATTNCGSDGATESSDDVVFVASVLKSPSRIALAEDVEGEGRSSDSDVANGKQGDGGVLQLLEYDRWKNSVANNEFGRPALNANISKESLVPGGIRPTEAKGADSPLSKAIDGGVFSKLDAADDRASQGSPSRLPPLLTAVTFSRRAVIGRRGPPQLQPHVDGPASQEMVATASHSPRSISAVKLMAAASNGKPGEDVKRVSRELFNEVNGGGLPDVSPPNKRTKLNNCQAHAKATRASTDQSLIRSPRKIVPPTQWPLLDGAGVMGTRNNPLPSTNSYPCHIIKRKRNCWYRGISGSAESRRKAREKAKEKREKRLARERALPQMVDGPPVFSVVVGSEDANITPPSSSCSGETVSPAHASSVPGTKQSAGSHCQKSSLVDRSETAKMDAVLRQMCPEAKRVPKDLRDIYVQSVHSVAAAKLAALARSSAVSPSSRSPAKAELDTWWKTILELFRSRTREKRATNYSSRSPRAAVSPLAAATLASRLAVPNSAKTVPSNAQANKSLISPVVVNRLASTRKRKLIGSPQEDRMVPGVKRRAAALADEAIRKKVVSAKKKTAISKANASPLAVNLISPHVKAVAVKKQKLSTVAVKKKKAAISVQLALKNKRSDVGKIKVPKKAVPNASPSNLPKKVWLKSSPSNVPKKAKLKLSPSNVPKKAKLKSSPSNLSSVQKPAVGTNEPGNAKTVIGGAVLQKSITDCFRVVEAASSSSKAKRLHRKLVKDDSTSSKTRVHERPSVANGTTLTSSFSSTKKALSKETSSAARRAKGAKARSSKEEASGKRATMKPAKANGKKSALSNCPPSGSSDVLSQLSSTLRETAAVVEAAAGIHMEDSFPVSQAKRRLLAPSKAVANRKGNPGSGSSTSGGEGLATASKRSSFTVSQAKRRLLAPSKAVANRKGNPGSGNSTSGGEGVVTASKRSSVRQAECAFRYREIGVRRHSNFIQVVLMSNTRVRNGLNVQVLQELQTVLQMARTDPKCNLLILNGTGSVFCSGVDLISLSMDSSSSTAEKMSNALKDLCRELLTFPKPLVAAVNGSAVGLGVTFLPFFDIVYASDKATFYTPYCKLGQIPECGATITFPSVMGYAKTNGLLMEGHRMTAMEAYDTGLITQVLWPATFMEEVIPRVQIIANYPTDAMMNTKALIRYHDLSKLEVTLDTECRVLHKQWASEECRLAMRDFLQDEEVV